MQFAKLWMFETQWCDIAQYWVCTFPGRRSASTVLHCCFWHFNVL